jgi:two-component system chemotaxis sensor kinase CheA
VDLSRYADLFLTESREHLSAINHALLELERTSGGAEPVAAIFRAVHTVKGMSATMGYAAVAGLSHELETLLDRVRRGERAVTPELMDALFVAADVLESAIEAAVAGKEEDVDIAEPIAKLRALSGEPAAAAAASPAATSAAPAAAATEWSAGVPEGEGQVVRVRLDAATVLRGVRAFVVLQRAGAVGEVTGVSPSRESLQADEFGRDFAFRLRTTAPPEEIEQAVRSAGEVETVLVFTGAAGVVAGRGARGAPPEAQSALGSPSPSHPSPAPPTAALRQQRHVRIDLRRLDALMNLIGELVITRGRLTQIASTLRDPALDETVAQASRLVTDLQDEIMTSRMVPVWQVFDRFPRLVRDSARALGKQIDFSIEGKEIELDRSMLDEIGDPIVHLLRNAIDHGIETAQARAAAGKPAVGRLALSAARDRSAVVIRVSDDGRGIDRARVLERAKSLALVDAGKAELTDEELIRLISRPGFSTAERVTDMSGRGVGMDTVQSRVRALGGSVDVKSVPGQGTTVTVRLPLTLAIVRALLARVGGETYALPMTHVNETVELEPAAMRTVRGKDVFLLRDDVLPLVRLRELVNLPAVEGRGTQQVVVLEQAERRAGLIVDELTGQQEIVVKQFDAVRDGLALFSGATILGDGAPALIVDVSSLL